MSCVVPGSPVCCVVPGQSHVLCCIRSVPFPVLYQVSPVSCVVPGQSLSCVVLGQSRVLCCIRPVPCPVLYQVSPVSCVVPGSPVCCVVPGQSRVLCCTRESLILCCGVSVMHWPCCHHCFDSFCTSYSDENHGLCRFSCKKFKLF